MPTFFNTSSSLNEQNGKIDEFMTKASEEAKKHEIKLPKTPKKPKTHFDCYQYVHNLALQKSGFRKTKKQLNLQGMTFKRKLLKPLVTISNPCLQLQNYVRFTDFSIEQKGQYLAGYIEATGCFCSDGSNNILKLAFGPKDRFVMIGIAQGLTDNMTQENAAAYGIRFNDSRNYNQGDLVIRKQALIDVLSLIHGHLMGEAKIQQIRSLGLDQLVNLNFEPLLDIRYSSLWLSGFMDGNGSIYYDKTQKKWIIEFSQNSKINPLLIQKICDLVPTSNGITEQKKENQERVSYSHPTIVFVWLELFQNQRLQTHKFHKLEQVKKHMQTMIENGIKQAHIESKLWNETFSMLDDEKKLRLLFKQEQKEIIASLSQWEKSYNFSTRKWTQEKKDLALKLKEQGYSMAQIGNHKDIQISRSHVQRFFQAPNDSIPSKKKIVFKLQPRPRAFLALTLSQMNEIDLLLDQTKTHVEIGKLIGCDRRIVGNYKTNAAWTKKLAREFEKRFPDQKENKAQKKKFLKEKKAEDS